MKAVNLREQSSEELAQQCAEAQQELRGIRAKRGLGEEGEPPMRMRALRRDVARMKTILREREREAERHG